MRRSFAVVKVKASRCTNERTFFFLCCWCRTWTRTSCCLRRRRPSAEAPFSSSKQWARDCCFSVCMVVCQLMAQAVRGSSLGTHLLNVLELQRPLVDGGVRNVVALGVLQQQRQVGVDVLDRLVLVVLHPVPVGNHGHSHLGRRAQKYCTVHSKCVQCHRGRKQKKERERKMLTQKKQCDENMS